MPSSSCLQLASLKMAFFPKMTKLPRMTQRELSSHEVLALLDGGQEEEVEDEGEFFMEGSDEEFSGCDGDLEEESGE